MEKECDDYRKKYNEKHKFCPKCGSIKHTSTLVGFGLQLDKKDDYKDLNNCVCSYCGDRHTTHDRISLGEVNKLKYK